MTTIELRELLGVRLGERAPSWACPELVATAAAATRLRRWVRAGRPSPTPAQIRARLPYLGDVEIRQVVLAVLAQLPPPVVDDALRAAWIIGVGRQTAGWVAAAPPHPAPDPDAEALGIIALAGRDDDTTVAGVAVHELAHFWLEPRPSVTQNVAPAARLAVTRTLVDLATRWGRPEYARLPFDRAAARERRACALARAWGYHNDSAACARGAVAALREEIRA